jgi:two-component system, NtrC family, response regulator GlrR
MTQVTKLARTIRNQFDWQKVQVYRLHVTGPDGDQTRQEYAKRILRVGSRDENDLTLPDQTVSRIHFEIGADAKGYRLRDLGSSNGTFVDGYRVNDVYLKPGSRIHAGHTEVIFEPLVTEAELPLSREERFGPLVGRSAAMRELFATLQRVASTDATVLVEAETGTGKELIAKAIHEASDRSGGALVVFDAAAAPKDLIESQLFGHERGAFTGATDRRTGCLEEADGGTLFIDELGELPLDLQPKLLRALESREVVPVGSNTPRKVDVRIVAATNRDLAEEVNRGSFRDDLYYRLAVVRLVVAPLRERPEDVPLLVEHVAGQLTDPGRAQQIMAAVDPACWDDLAGYHWPGNVRELRNMVERTLALSGNDLPTRFDPGLGGRGSTARTPGPSSRRAPPASQAPARGPQIDLERPFLEQKHTMIAKFEEGYLTLMLERHGGNISRAAAAAGLDRMYFKRLLKKYR